MDLEPGRANMDALAERALTPGKSSGHGAAKQNEERTAFGAGLLIAQENERRNLAMELHDDLSQRLALLELTVETLEKAETTKPQVRDQLHSVHEQIVELASALRKIAYQLHPGALEQLGLGPAVESFVREFSNREGIETRFQSANLPGTIDSNIALCLYRIVQESLRNVARHSGAKTAEVLLSRGDNVIQLRVKDSGSGFDYESTKPKHGLGLRSMEERARACGGSFHLTSRPGSGTEILVEVPELRPAEIS
ncbi:MAG TPA: sensor histidine kinase [Bryobacteraceae bacterium]|nr:sensor histidine kinase [Bryobacteraceae bacterium]